MAFFRLQRTAATLAAAGLALSGAVWAQGSPPDVAPPTSAVTSPNTPPATGSSGSQSGGTPATNRTAPAPSGATGAAPAAPAASASKPAHADASFMDDAAHAGHYEVEAAKLALQKGQSDAVKSFAQRMIDDHTAAAQQLQALASAKNHKLPDGPSMVQKGKLKLLSTHEGAKFDKSYIDSLGPKAHRDTIKLFEKAASKGHDADVKAFADKTLPTLREHLTLAEQLDQSMNGKDQKNATHDAPRYNKDGTPKK
ncbi:DUF4142 domain-containing protein [Pulveribacter sp.]|uniref:DUF4142 domain-containing protein n=1 Tax=Pulveribacter sp. TaxID=2678893 RepID=UPI0028A5870A|nr:DUF4142 domain-containing protein [Pulveribacter sp.]